ncbi:unnamed protein product [Anisakis simplex]|uniref:Uncharacterized protein n=1 Tax=Anisakis simplex TaxID=6269 RepID=A0A0M3JPS9_ANISI|nr:unnamed protein product [Anisakis simplex]
MTEFARRMKINVKIPNWWDDTDPLMHSRPTTNFIPPWLDSGPLPLGPGPEIFPPSRLCKVNLLSSKSSGLLSRQNPYYSSIH